MLSHYIELYEMYLCYVFVLWQSRKVSGRAACTKQLRHGLNKKMRTEIHCDTTSESIFRSYRNSE